MSCHYRASKMCDFRFFSQSGFIQIDFKKVPTLHKNLKKLRRIYWLFKIKVIVVQSPPYYAIVSNTHTHTHTHKVCECNQVRRK